MMSSKTKYGLHALIYLTKRYGKGPILIAKMAEDKKIPKKFLEAILLELKNQGILISKKGKGGGYELAKDPAAVKIGQIIRILDGPIAPVPCVSQTAYRKCDECPHEDICAIRFVMRDVREAIANILDKTSLADLSKNEQRLSESVTASYNI